MVRRRLLNARGRPCDEGPWRKRLEGSSVAVKERLSFPGVYYVPGLSSDHIAPASPSEEDKLPRLEEGRHI